MSDLQQAIAWFESRAQNTPMPGARKMFQIALEALLEKVERENTEPLTLEELRQMEGEPVWVKIIGASDFCWPKDAWDDYGLVRKSWVRMWDRSRADIFTVAHHFEEYGKSWLAYRNKPKEAEEK